TVDPLPVPPATETGASLAFQVSDPSGVAARSVKVSLDGSDLYPGNGDLVDGRYQASIAGPLAWGPHLVGVDATDGAGNVRHAAGRFPGRPAITPRAPAASSGDAWSVQGVKVAAGKGGAIQLDAAVDEYEDARVSLRGMRGALSVAVDPADSDALLVT